MCVTSWFGRVAPWSAVAALVVTSCDKPLAVSPTKAPTPGLSVCWRAVDDGDIGTDRALHVTVGNRLKAAGYALVERECDLSISWGYTTKGRPNEEAFRSARLIIRDGNDKLVDHREFEFGPSDLPADDSDRLAIVLVNAMNASTKVAAVSHRAASSPTSSNKTSGRVPPVMIQRIVRQNFPAMKACYSMALAKDPNVGGRTATRFVIDSTGHVSSSTDVEASSTLPAEVRDCVAKQFAGLQFPPPEGGVVTVVYPLIFSPGTGAPPVAQDGGATPVSASPATTDAGTALANGAFDRGAAARALDEAARSLQSCAIADGPRGSGHVMLTFDPSGAASLVLIDGGPFANTPAGACIVNRFSKVQVPSFSGNQVTVGKSFDVR